MRKIMIRNTLLMLLVTAVFSGALMLYLRSASSITVGEAGAAGGTYTGTAYGFGSDVVVTAGYTDGVLVSLSADASGETAEIGGAAAEELVAAILAAGSADGIDTIASATLTSDAVLSAFANCEAQAGRLTGESYTATVAGFSSDVVVTASYAGSTLTDLTIDASGETPEYGGAAAEELTTAILAAGGANGVDAISGATITSDAVFAALADCASQAGVNTGNESSDDSDAHAGASTADVVGVEDIVVTPGADAYTASAEGYSSDVTVTMEYAEDGTIASVVIDASGETEALGGAAATELATAIVDAGSANDVDAIAKATVTSNAVLAAARYIEQAVILSNATVYQASEKGYEADVIVTAAYNDAGELVSLTIDASGETPKLGGATAADIEAKILAAGNADELSVDAYASSTMTAQAALDAFAACEDMIGSPSNLVTVTGTAKGYDSDVIVTATYANGALTALKIDASGETPKLGGATAEDIQTKILAAGNADELSVDAYANSTMTAQAALDAFAACQDQVG